VAVPTYISEIAPTKDRGKLVAAYQFNIVLGILIAFLTNYVIGTTLGTGQWRLMLGLEAVPALFYCIMIIRVSESPRWLIIHKNDTVQATTVLQQLNQEEDIPKLISEIRQTVHNEGAKERFFTGKYRLPILLAFLLAFFNQLSGINFVLYYAPRIFEMAGLGAQTALLSSTGIGVTNLLFTMLGVYLIDRSGRKQLMLIGSLGYIFTLSVISWAFMKNAGGEVVVIFVFGFIAAHAIGQGAVIWVFISEIFPNQMRAYGQAWGTSIHWIFAALITALTLPVIRWLDDNPWPLFAFFAGMMVLQLCFTLFMMPETRNISLEKLEKKLLKE
jgi:sugar porter (SP) family MFS transporter